MASSSAASYVCRACAESPGSHSFVGVGEHDGSKSNTGDEFFSKCYVGAVFMSA